MLWVLWVLRLLGMFRLVRRCGVLWLVRHVNLLFTVYVHFHDVSTAY